MKKTIVLLSAVLLFSAVATAATTSPEGFEGYALTTDFTYATFAGEGWNNFNTEGNPNYPGPNGETVQIVNGSAGNATQVLQVDSPVGLNLHVDYNGLNIPDSAGPLTKTSVDFNGQFLFGSEFRIYMARNTDAAQAVWGGNRTWGIVIGYGNWWGGGAGIPKASLSVLESSNPEDPYDAVLGGGEFDSTGFEPGTGWWTLEVEEDNILSKTRARIGPTGGTMNPWSAWYDHAPSVFGLDYATEGYLRTFTNTICEYDNITHTPEPATMLLLGAGSLLLIRRKR